MLLRQRDKDKEKEHYKEDEGYVVKQAKSLVDLAYAMDNAKIDFELQGNKDPQDIENLKKKWTTELPSTKWRYGLVEVLGWLLVMVFLARKEQD